MHAEKSSIQDAKFARFYSEIKDHSRESTEFVDRGLLEIIERNWDFHNMAITRYCNGRFTSAMSYVTDVPSAKVMLMIREYYRASYYRSDKLAHYVTGSVAELTSMNDCSPVQARAVLSDREFQEYASFFGPYDLQDAIVLPIDQDTRITIFWKKGIGPVTSEMLQGISLMRRILQECNEEWKYMSRSIRISYMKDRIISEQGIGLAILDDKNHVVECNSLFFERATEMYHTSDLSKAVSNLMICAANGLRVVNGYRLEFERSGHNKPENINSYSCLQLRPLDMIPMPKVAQEPIEAKSGIGTLTAREMEIMERYSKGETAKVIASKLYISEWTVKAHLKNIYKKLDINNQRQMVMEYDRFFRKS